MMTHGYQLAAGSMIGRDHRHAYRNNQDGYTILDDGEVLVAVVTDGCGSGTRSEVGAQLGARLVAESIRATFHSQRGIQWLLVERRILSHMDLMVQAMGGDYLTTVKDYFLFTIVGLVADADTTTFFMLGDGMIIVNDEITRPEFEGNEPPYLGYALLPPERVDIDPALLRLQPTITYQSDDVQSFLLGSDGVDDIIQHELRLLPGMNDAVGPIEQFWEADRYFGGNPVLLSRRLLQMGRDWPIAAPNPGLLHDDTTLIVGRRTLDTERE